MITTDKNVKHYGCSCGCGREIEFGSNQPGGDTIDLICNCFNSHRLRLPGNDTKYSYKLREDTRRVRLGIIDIFQDIKRIMTVRQVFYQAVGRGIVPKDEKQGYNIIQRNLLEMRRHGILPYSFVADVSRRWIKPQSYNGLSNALDNWMNFYRQDVWANQDNRVEIWLEKDALAGIFLEVTRKWDVPLFIARGFSSESFLYDAAENIKEIGKPTHVYFFSDYDPSGMALCKQVETMLPKFGANIIFNRASLVPWQVEYYKLPTRPTKKSNHSGDFEGQSVELDALHPDILHELIERCILQHISKRELKNIQMEEEVQRQTIRDIRNNLVQA